MVISVFKWDRRFAPRISDKSWPKSVYKSISLEAKVE